MEKEFDKWNEFKKHVHARPDTFGVHEREIWWVAFGVNVGVEIDGKHNTFERPALVLRRFNLEMVWVLPITSNIKNAKFYEKLTFDGKEYFVALTQIRTVSTKRFLRKIGMISKSDFAKIQSRLIDFIKNERKLAQGELSRRPKP